MLCLSRKENEAITIGPDIRVTVVRIHASQVKLTIEAPQWLRVVRSELPERDRLKDQAAEMEVRGRLAAEEDLASIELDLDHRENLAQEEATP